MSSRHTSRQLILRFEKNEVEDRITLASLPSVANREAAVAKSSADQERVIAEAASLAKQAEAQCALDIRKARFTEQSRRQEAQADKAYELQTSVMQQKVVAEQVKVLQIEKEQQVKVQEAEARVMNVKAAAYQEWTQAAVVDKLVTNMPDIVRAMTEPLGKVGKITIVSTGNDGGTGTSKITREMTKIAAQVPALFEALSGMKMTDLMANVKSMKPRDHDPDPDPDQPPA